VGVERNSRGNAAFFIAPSDTYRTRDGWITVQTIGNEMFARWARLVGREDLLEDPRFSDDLGRADHCQTITDAMNR
jgi:formyl-CoA transferase